MTSRRRPRTEPVELPYRPLYRISDVAAYYDVSERTVRLWVEHGHLKVVQKPGGQLRITQESLESCGIRFNLPKKV